MPAMNFPSSPTNGQAYGQYVYDSTKGAWRVLADLIASAVPSPTAPTSPISGDLWFNTTDGVLFMYFNDGNSSQWVEMKSNTASGSTVAARVDALEAKPSGLVPMVPTAVSVGSGSASTSTSGLVTFTGASSISLQNVFNSGYTNYRILFRQSNSGGTASDSAFRFLTTGSTVDSTANYYDQVSYTLNNGAGAGFYHFGATQGWVSAGGLARAHVVFDVFSPYQLSYSSTVYQGSVHNGSNMYSFYGSTEHIGVTSMSGFQIYPTSGNTITGTIQVLGYR